MASSSTPKSSLVIRRLYRNMLRTIKPYTSSPDAKVLQCLLHRTGLDDDISDWESFVKANGLEKGHQARDLSYSYLDAKAGGRFQDNDRDHKLLFRRLLREVVTGEKGVRRMPVPSMVDTSRLQQVIRREFRNEKGSMSTYFNELTRREVAFTALRELNKKLSVMDNLDSSEESPNQAAWQVSSLPVSKPSSILQPGVFLMSHPHMNDSFFARTVICILDYENEAKNESAAKRFDLDALGPTYGLIVNRLSLKDETDEKRTLREAFDENMLPERMADIFGDMPVKDGGPVHPSLQMLYSLPGSKENTIDGTLIPTIPNTEDSASTAEYTDRATYFQGDVFHAMTAIKDGKLDKNEMSFFVGASTWAPGQLESEMAHGFWIPCRGPAEIALTGTCEHRPSTNKTDPPPVSDLWLSMMSACGKDEARLASIFYYQEWDENMLPCDAFDGEDIDPDIF